MLEPWHFEFFRYGILAATLAGALCGAIGVHAVLRKMSYMGHGLSHAIFGGAVAGYVIGVNFYLGAVIWGVVAALAINAVAGRRGIGGDAAIGVITTASFAVGVALISHSGRHARNFEAALFGDVLGVTLPQITVLAVTGIAITLLLTSQYRRVAFLTFDPEVARVFGVRTGLLETSLSLGLAATIVASIQILGVTLIAAVLVIPPITARLLTDSFAKMLFLSAAIGGGSGFIGVYLSYYLDIASGATVVLVATAVFMAVFVATFIRDRRRLALLGSSSREPEPANDALTEVQ